MKKFMTVLKFELSNYIQSKSYVISTAVIMLLIIIIMFLPRFIDMSDFLGMDDNSISQDAEEEQGATEETDDETADSETAAKYVIYDKSGAFEDLSILEDSFYNSQWVSVQSEDEVEKQVEEQEAEAGFVVESLNEYSYYIYNKDFYDMDTEIFDSLLTQAYRIDYCEEHDLDLEKVMQLIDVPIQSTEQVLGKDMGSSYWYCYILVIAVFMIIILYCVMIATSVTNEKSNRSIEVLITSTTSNSLIFGKVIAGTIASFLQVGFILLTALGGYAINRDNWGGMLDNVLNIPTDVLVVFALFAIFGFIFYAFIYAAVGALCSKTEDINKSASGVQMVIMIIYFLVLLQMSNIDGTAMKILSFLPLSSYSAMYIRVAMGEVAVWEIIISFLILLASTAGIGYIASKIYRMGTLRYGNPISIRSAIKSLRDKTAE